MQTAASTALGAVDGSVFTVDHDDSGAWEVSVVTADGTDNEVGVAADGTTITRGPSTDSDDGTATWEVQLDGDTAEKTSVDVDASTGAVLRTERDD